jgi:hypothetical protein
VPSEKEDLTLYGGKARRFREIRDELREQLGYEPSKPEVIGLLMAGYDDIDDIPLIQ